MALLNRRSLFAAAALAATGLGAAWWQRRATAQAPAVDYVLLDGSRHHSAQAWRDKVVLVNFWATSCATCVKEMPQLVATHQRFAARGFDTLAVAMQYDRPDYVSRFAETRQLPFGVALDSTGAIAHAFGPVRATPTTFLLNRRREIVWRAVGEPDFADLHRLIERLL